MKAKRNAVNVEEADIQERSAEPALLPLNGPLPPPERCPTARYFTACCLEPPAEPIYNGFATPTGYNRRGSCGVYQGRRRGTEASPSVSS